MASEDSNQLTYRSEPNAVLPVFTLLGVVAPDANHIELTLFAAALRIIEPILYGP